MRKLPEPLVNTAHEGSNGARIVLTPHLRAPSMTASAIRGNMWACL